MLVITGRCVDGDRKQQLRNLAGELFLHRCEGTRFRFEHPGRWVTFEHCDQTRKRDELR